MFAMQFFSLYHEKNDVVSQPVKEWKRGNAFDVFSQLSTNCLYTKKINIPTPTKNYRNILKVILI